MKRPELLDFSQERIRVLHFTWIAFFISFYLWFNIAPLATTMLRRLAWLTPDHLKALAIVNVALTIPARILIGVLIDRFGPRRVFSGLLIFCSLPALIFAFAGNFWQLLISRLVLSCVGASFVIGIRMTAEWFPPKMVGRAEGFYAGWGNFGSAAAAMTLPWIALEFFGAYYDGWRYALALNALVALVYGVIYLFVVRDTPSGKRFEGIKKVQPMELSSWGDLILYILWSFPLVAALGLLAYRLSKISLDADGAKTLVSPAMMYVIFGVLGLVFIVHVIKTLQVNVPKLKAGIPPSERYHFNSVVALNTTYIANFGAELAVVSMLPAFFEATYSISPVVAGLIASSFAFVNLFARPLGGLLSDMMQNRKRVMVIYMFGIALGFLGMALINATWPIYLAIIMTVACSIFVQGAEGATFALIPLIKKRFTGQIAGMAGAYGNVGAVVYLVIYSLVDARTFFLILAGGAAVSFIYCLIFLREPKDAFADDPAAIILESREPLAGVALGLEAVRNSSKDI